MAINRTHLVKFGNGSSAYTFPIHQGNYSDSFSDTVNRTSRQPGLDGGYDDLGTTPAPSEIGQIRVSFGLAAEDTEDMTGLRDAVRAMKNLGKRRLYMQPSDDTDTMRFCMARVNSINMSEDRGAQTDLLQRVEINFQASDPRWLAWEGMIYTDDGHTTDTGLTTIDPRLSSSVSNGSTVTLTHNGNAPTPVTLRLIVTSVNYSTLVQVQQVNADGTYGNGWQWTGFFQQTETLTVDGHTASVRHFGSYSVSSGYPEFTRLVGTGFIILQPGANTLKVTTSSGVTCTLEADFNDAWR